MELSNSAYARHRGITEGAVRKAIKQGRISQTASGKIDPKIADQQWDKNSDPAQVKSLSSTSKESHESTYQHSRAIREAYNASMAKLQYEKEVGKLINRDQVRMDAYNAGRLTRDRLLTLPKKIAPLVIGKTDLKEIETLIKTHLLDVLTELSESYGSNQ